MKIWIDADACPASVKEILYRASRRLEIPLCLVANRDLRHPSDPLFSAVRVPQGFDVADGYIAQNAAPGDLIVTADIPLAALIVEGGATAIDPRGELYTEENIGERLSLRDFMQDLRSDGLVQGGPPELRATDSHRFASALDRWLTARMKSPPPGARGGEGGGDATRESGP
ncbi:MAG: YaiI/YqxD family protein [bacterium]